MKHQVKEEYRGESTEELSAAIGVLLVTEELILRVQVARFMRLYAQPLMKDIKKAM